MCEQALRKSQSRCFELWKELLRTLAVIFQQERPVAGINGRRGSFRLDDICVWVRLYERHCCDVSSSYGTIDDAGELENFWLGRNNFAVILAGTSRKRILARSHGL